MKQFANLNVVLLPFVIFISCKQSPGEKSANDFPEIPDFKYLNQDSMWVTKSDFENSIFVVDFFFTRCKSICPIMKSNMTKLYFEFEKVENVKFLSHTIDPEYDKVDILNKYANRLGVNSSKWHFVTGTKEDIYEMAHNIYKNSVLEDKGTEEGFIHSGAFILVGSDGKIIKQYDGLNSEEIHRLTNDIRLMLAEIKKKEQDTQRVN